MIRRSVHSLSALRRWSSSVQHVDYKFQAQHLPKDSTVFSMVQPTGKFHLGNYLGATRVWKDFCDSKQDVQKLIFGVADLHAITMPKPNTKEFRQFRTEAIASILSVGIDPSKAIVMHQSHIPQHSQLHWILSTFASMGLLNRMTQWKSKSHIKDMDVDPETMGKVKLGLFSYPILQAADILLYKSTHVPVGDDQTQHLELTRTVAQQFNKMYNVDFFPLPTTVLAPTKKILSLTSPMKKMSKSDPNQQGIIYLNDEPSVIQSKIFKALTDNISDNFYFDPQNRPGVSNLINIISGIQRKSIEEVENDIAVFNNYRDLKKYISEIIIEDLKIPRENFKKFMKDPDYLNAVIQEGTEKAQGIAEKNIKEIMTIIGF